MTKQATKVETNKTQRIGQKADNFQALLVGACKAQRASDKGLTGVSDQLLQLARPLQPAASKGIVFNAATAKEDEKEPSTAFEAACKLAENYIKSDSAGRQKTSTLPRCWTQAKSNIKAALNFGIDLSAYNTESSLRKEVNKARKAAKSVDNVEEAVKTVTKELNKLPEAQALDLLANMMVEAKRVLGELVPNEPVKPQTVDAINVA